MRYLRSSALTARLIKAGCLREPAWMSALRGLEAVRAQPVLDPDARVPKPGTRTRTANDHTSRVSLLQRLRRRLAERHPEWLLHVVVDLNAPTRAERDVIEKFVRMQAELIQREQLSEEEAYERTLAVLRSELPRTSQLAALVEQQQTASKSVGLSQVMVTAPSLSVASPERPLQDPEAVFLASLQDAQRDRWLFEQFSRRLTS